MCQGGGKAVNERNGLPGCGCGPGHVDVQGPGNWEACPPGLSEVQTLRPKQEGPTSGSLEALEVLSSQCNSPKLDVATASENLFNQPVIGSPRVC